MTAPYGLFNDPGESGAFGQQPGAIASLLSSMATPPVQSIPQGPGGAGMAPPPQAAPLPPMAAPERPHMLHRIAGLLGSLGSNVAGTVQGFATTDTPQGYEGLLSQQEAEGAKGNRLQNILTALGGVDPHVAYQGRLDHIIALHGAASQLAEQKRLDAVRANMAEQFTPKPGASQDDIRDLNERMYAYAIRNNDPTTAKLLESSNVEAMKRVKSPGAVLHEGPNNSWWDLTDPNKPRQIVAGGETTKNKQIVNAQEGIFEMRADGLYDAATGAKYTGKTLHPVQLAPNLTTFQDYNPADPTAAPTTKLLNPRTGQVGPAIGSGKASVTKAESVTNMAKEMLVKSGVSQMENADGAMRAYEEKLISGKASISGLSQFLGATGANFSHDDPASRAIQAASLAVLNRTNPDLARYIRRGLEYAQGESQVTSRPSDFRIKLSDFLSTASSGANADMIGDVQNTRHMIVAPMRASLDAAGKTSGMAPSPSRGASALQEKYDAAAAHLKAKGVGDADIVKQIGARP